MEKDRDQPDYDALLRLYGQANLRVAQLENQVSQLTDQLRSGESDRSSGEASAPGPEGLREIADKVDNLSRLVEGSFQTRSGGESQPPASQEGLDQGDRSNDVTQLRLHMSSIANQLAQAQAELQTLRGCRKRRVRKDREVPWWKKVLRRLGLSQSRE